MEQRRPLPQPADVDPGIESKVAFLRRPDAYPESTARVDVLETHMSWVFLTQRFAYKLKKPVHYEFLDFRSLAARRHDCEEEVRLNRRLAPRAYVGTVALTLGDDAGLHVGGDGVAVDWLVKMHRLPRERMLDRIIASGHAVADDLRGVALLLARFYRDAEPVTMLADDYRNRLAAEIAASRLHLRDEAYELPRTLVDRICAAQSRFVARDRALLDRRIEQRRIVEGHGDLRPEHVCLTTTPQIIDCLEFKREFRVLDCADELAFLSLECERLGAPFVGAVLFDAYIALTGDTPPDALIAFYKSLRACLRAKLSVWHLRDDGMPEPRRWTEKALEYLALAERHGLRLA